MPIAHLAQCLKCESAFAFNQKKALVSNCEIFTEVRCEPYLGHHQYTRYFIVGADLRYNLRNISPGFTSLD